MVKYRYFGPMLRAQAKWLNKMARRGWRLADTGKLDYSFVPCEPGEYQYAVDYVGNFSRERGEDYAQFLAGCGYRTWFKNVNLQWSRGKLRWNPAGEPGARISSERTNLDRELIIVERRAEAGEFRLYTTVEDELDVLRGMRRKHLYAALIFAALGALAPVLKVTANRATYQNMIDNMDIDVSGVTEGEVSIEEAGASMLDEVLEVCNGKTTKAESYGFSDIAIDRICRFI